MAQYDVDLRDYWRIVKKRKMIIFLLVILVGISSYGFAKLKEPKPLYQADSAIKIERSGGFYSMMTGGFWFPTENMETHAYILTSYPVLVMTAKGLGWIPENMTDEDVWLSGDTISAVERLKGLVEAKAQEGTNIIDIQSTATDPEEAAQVANTLANAYRRFNVQEKNRRTIETKKFIEDQLQITSNNLKQAEKNLQIFKEENGLIAIDAQTQNNLDRLYTVEAFYEKIGAEKNDISEKLKVLGKLRSGSTAELEKTIFAVSEDSPAFALRTKLSELFLERQTLLIHLTEKHPQVIEVDDKIRAVVQEIQKELESQLRTLKIQDVASIKKIDQLKKENHSLPEQALQLVRLERELELQDTLYSQLKTKYQETLIQESGQVEEVSIVRPAVVPKKPFNIPSKLMIVVTGLVMGLIVGVVLAFGAEVFDTSMGTIEDVEESLQVPVLGVIPFLGREETGHEERSLSEKDRARDLITHYDPKSLAAEAFRSLRTNIQFMSLEIKGKTFLITSSFVKEGKSLNVINLALSVAQAGEKVLLVEADLRKPVVYRNFGLAKEPGLTDFVLGNYDWLEVVNNITDVMLGDFEIDEILRTPGLDNLHIMTAGTRPPNPTEILSSGRFRQFLAEAAEKFDYVFIDAPPILPVADATEIAPVVDGVVLVYTVGRIGRGVLKRAKASLDNVDAKVLGVILNNVKPEVGPDYFRYHSQHYYGPEEDKPEDAAGGVFKKLLGRWKQRLSNNKNWALISLVVACGFLLIGVFWQELF
jgi:capsular exopolysaccharide synthesis family protein